MSEEEQVETPEIEAPAEGDVVEAEEETPVEDDEEEDEED
jgi:hypothetical protein